MTKWIFSDYDGTINVNWNDKWNQEDIDFINKWINSGNKFIINTGRMPSEIEPILKRYNVDSDYIICNNGSLIYKADEGIIKSFDIEKKYIMNIIPFLKTITKDAMIGYTTNTDRKMITYLEIPELTNFFEDKDVVEEFKPKMSTFEELEKEEHVISISIYTPASASPELEVKVKKLFKELTIIRLLPQGFEIVVKDVGKNTGIEWLQKEHKFKVEDTYTLGDGPNDEGLFSFTKNAFLVKSKMTTPKLLESSFEHIKGIFELEKFL